MAVPQVDTRPLPVSNKFLSTDPHVITQALGEHFARAAALDLKNNQILIDQRLACEKARLERALQEDRVRENERRTQELHRAHDYRKAITTDLADQRKRLQERAETWKRENPIRNALTDVLGEPPVLKETREREARVLRERAHEKMKREELAKQTLESADRERREQDALKRAQERERQEEQKMEKLLRETLERAGKTQGQGIEAERDGRGQSQGKAALLPPTVAREPRMDRVGTFPIITPEQIQAHTQAQQARKAPEIEMTR